MGVPSEYPCLHIGHLSGLRLPGLTQTRAVRCMGQALRPTKRLGANFLASGGVHMPPLVYSSNGRNGCIQAISPNRTMCSMLWAIPPETFRITLISTFTVFLTE